LRKDIQEIQRKLIEELLSKRRFKKKLIQQDSDITMLIFRRLLLYVLLHAGPTSAAASVGLVLVINTVVATEVGIPQKLFEGLTRRRGKVDGKSTW
jgi:hypothetical protein